MYHTTYVVYNAWILLNHFIYAYHPTHIHMIYFGTMYIYEIEPNIIDLKKLNTNFF